MSPDMDEWLPVGMPRGQMRAADWTKYRQIQSAWLAETRRFVAADRSLHTALRPYLRKGMDTAHAVAAWRADHPGQHGP